MPPFAAPQGTSPGRQPVPGPRAAPAMRRIAALALAALLGATLPAAAETQPDRWTGELTLYGWLSALGGDAVVDRSGRELGFSVDVADVLDNLQFAGFAALEVRRGRLGLFTDVVVASLANATSEPGNLGLRVSGRLTTAVITAAAGWRVYESGGLFADVLGGARVFNVDASATVGRANPAPTSNSASEAAVWANPVVGLRLGWNVTEKLRLIGEADIGAWTVGSSSTYNLYAGANYAVAPGTRLELGYRYLAFEYDTGRVTTDVRMHGVALGVTIGF